MAPRAEFMAAGGLSAADVSAWRVLADSAAEANPFARPEFVLSAAREGGRAVALAVVREGGRWLACLPVRRAGRWGRLPLPCLAPWLPAYAYLATPLVDRDAVAPATEALAGLVLADRAAAALVLDPIDPAGPVAVALGAALAARGRRPVVYADFERAVLRRRPEPTYLEEAVSASGRKKLRKQARRLTRELGGRPAVVDRSADPAAPGAFLTMERMGWKAEQGTAMASRPRDAAFFEAMCARMAAAGYLQILALEAGGRTAAMQVNLLDGDTWFAFKVAFEPELARFSPGALLEVEALDVFHRRAGTRLADSCAAPDSALVNRLWPDRRRLQTLLLPTGAPHARLLRPAVRAEATMLRVHRRVRDRRDRSGAPA